MIPASLKTSLKTPTILKMVFGVFCLGMMMGGGGAVAATKDTHGLDDAATGAGLPVIGVTGTYAEGTTVDMPSLIGKYIGYILSFLGIIFFVLMIYAGFLWMTARGEEAQVEKARTLIYQAVIGLIIVLSAYAITNYVGTKITQ